MNGVASEQQPQRRFIEACDMDDDGRGPGGIARLGAVIAALEAGYRADGGIIFGTLRLQTTPPTVFLLFAEKSLFLRY